MKFRIDTVAGRDKLAARNAPYWVRLVPGVSLGYRKTSDATAGAWLARIKGDGGKELWRSLGPFAELPANERYHAAKRAAEALAGHVDRGGNPDAVTVKAACASYVQHIRGADAKKAGEIAARFARWIDGHGVADVPLQKLTARALQGWRADLTATPVTINPHAPEDQQRTRTRSAGSLNRDMTALRAALNHAMRLGDVTHDGAWKAALQPVAGADKRREVYLSRAERARLIESAPADLAAFVRGLSMLPIRPGALAALVVGDFDKQLQTLKVWQDKSGGGRTIKLPPGIAAFLGEQCRGKHPSAPLFARADGSAWGKDSWKKPFKAAVVAAGLPTGTVVYSLRHAAITDLVTSGLDLLTAARLSGTSASMIERHYGHLQQDVAAAALAKLAL